jgi:hypothetical protein
MANRMEEELTSLDEVQKLKDKHFNPNFIRRYV